MRKRGARTLAKVGRWGRDRLAGGGLILLYHRIANPSGQPEDLVSGFEVPLRQAGYERACTSIVGVARPLVPPLRMPRYWVGDWPGRALSSRIRRWLGG